MLSPGLRRRGPRAVTYADGFSGAPVATIQHPLRLASLKYRPPWRVAGVDFAVGYPSSTVLKVPGVDAMPTGATYFAGTGTIGVTGSNVVLDAWNLDGVAINISSGTNCTITNNYMRITAGKVALDPSPLIRAQATALGNLTITNNVIDGNQLTTGNFDGLINNAKTGGTTIIEYNWIKNAILDCVQNSGGAGTFRARYNLIEDNGWQVGGDPHSDWVQFSGVSGSNFFSVDISFNAFGNDNSSRSTQGVFLTDNFFYCQYDAVNVSNNTIWGDAAGGCTYALIGDDAQMNCTATWNQNYIDPTNFQFGTWNIQHTPAYGPYSGPVVRTGNINMVTGEALNS